MNCADHDEKLERLIGNTLQGQPPRHAPGTLQSRVLAEIEHRAMTPWWRMSFARWPVAAQVLFLIASTAIIKFAVDASNWLMNGLDSTRVVTGVASVAMPVKVMAEIISSVAHSIPSLWLYAGIGALAAMYAALFGISAAAYRTLYASR